MAEYAPSRDDPVVRAASAVIGGPAGRRMASATGFWRGLPVLVLLACIVLSLGLVQKQHCRAEGWSSPDQFWHACYSDIPVLYGSASLGGPDRAGLVQSLGENGLGQPPLTGALMWFTSALVQDSGSSAPRQFFDVSAVLLTVLLAFAVVAVGLAAGRRRWNTAHLALSPVLFTAGLISYELLAVALTATALLALTRSRTVLGGVLLGLAVASAPQVAVIGLGVAVLAHRWLRNVTGLAFVGSAIGAWLVVRMVLLPGLGGGLGSAWVGWRNSAPGYGSIWLVPQLLGDSKPPGSSAAGKVLIALVGWIFRVNPLTATAASILSLLLLAVLLAVVLWLTVGTDPTLDPTDLPAEGPGPARFVERVAPLALAMVAVVLVASKSLPVQASLLLLPLIALSGLRWRDHLIWAGTELVYFVGIWLYIAGETTPTRGLPAAFYLIMLLARLVGISWLGVQGVLAYRDREHSSVRADPVDYNGPAILQRSPV